VVSFELTGGLLIALLIAGQGYNLFLRAPVGFDAPAGSDRPFTHYHA
jgi:hypothetical protein